jgi:hypothetical protein
MVEDERGDLAGDVGDSLSDGAVGSDDDGGDFILPGDAPVAVAAPAAAAAPPVVAAAADAGCSSSGDSSSGDSSSSSMSGLLRGQKRCQIIWTRFLQGCIALNLRGM